MDIRAIRRYVAVGDSLTQGWGDPDPDGRWRGWADRLAERLARRNGSLAYANLAERGARAAHVLEYQVPPALELDPDLLTVHAGVNDLLTPRMDVAVFAEDVDRLLGALADPRRTLLVPTMPPVFEVVPVPRAYLRRVDRQRREMNAAIGAAADRHGAHLIDVGELPEGRDARYWAEDRLHPNSHGHELLARQAFAVLEGRDPGDVRIEAPAVELEHWPWIREHLAPWLWQGLVRAREEHPAKLPAYRQMSGATRAAD